MEKTKELIITHEFGIHLRPAGLLVKTAKQYSSDITIEKDGMVVDGKSIIGITTLHAERNATILIKARGKDADQAIEALARLVTNNFEET